MYTVPISVARTGSLHVLPEGGRALADLTTAAIQVEMPSWSGASSHLGATVYARLEEENDIKKKGGKKKRDVGQADYPAL